MSTAIINALFFAFFNSFIFLFKDGPAATSIAGIPCGIISANWTVLYDLYKNPKNLDSKEYKIPDTVKTIGEDAAYKLKHMDAWA